VEEFQVKPQRFNLTKSSRSSQDFTAPTILTCGRLERDPSAPGDGMMMSVNIFMGLCVLGVDFLIYVLFQWTYGDKRRAMQKKLAEQRKAMEAEKSRPFLLPSRKGGAVTQARLQRVRERMAGVA
jgi:hypothetical protein